MPLQAVLVVNMRSKGIERAHINNYSKFLFKLPFQGSLRVLPEIHLSSGELPFVGFEVRTLNPGVSGR
jgi:hypothetical protein